MTRTSYKKVASVAWNTRLKHIGGAPVSAMAFRDWMWELGIDSDVLSFTAMGKPYWSEKWEEGRCISHYGSGHKIHKFDDFADVLNSYDFIFFSAPFPLGGKDMRDPAMQAKYVDRYKKLKVPFTVMLHGDYDLDKYYEEDLLREILHMKNCKSLCVVEEGHWGIGIKPEHGFYPCTLPGYLLKSDEFWSYKNRKSMLYTGRFSSVKNVRKLAMMAAMPEFPKALGSIDVYGKPNGLYIESMNNMVKKIGPDWNWKQEFYFVFDVPKMKDLYGGYKYYWNVAGSKKVVYEMSRFDLTGAEAVSCGCVPLLSPHSSRPEFESCCIYVDNLDPDWEDVLAQIEMAEARYPKQLSWMRDAIFDSGYDYNSVRNKIRKVLR
jgi:hypothetical protein